MKEIMSQSQAGKKLLREIARDWNGRRWVSWHKTDCVNGLNSLYRECVKTRNFN